MKSYYSKKNKRFYVESNNVKNTFKTISQLYAFLNKDFTNVDFLEYKFNVKELRKYNLSKSIISSRTMKALGIEGSNLKTTLDNISSATQLIIHSQNNTEINEIAIDNSSRFNYENISNECVVFYISDMHLEYKLFKKIRNGLNAHEVNKYFNEVIDKLLRTLPNNQKDKIVIFLGDILNDFELYKMFFQAYVKKTNVKTFVILGNHELWDLQLIEKCNTIEDIVSEYKEFLCGIGITLLENELYISGCNEKTLTKDEILNINNTELEKLINNSDYVVLGGIGFSGLNNEFNFNNGIYRNAPINRDQEIERSEIFKSLHNKLVELSIDKKIFIATHMPLNDWLGEKPQNKWNYIFGHTHRNFIYHNEEYNIYANNQIGYERNSFSFKFIDNNSCFTIEDGIHKISNEKYISYYQTKRIDMTLNHFGEIIMVKNGGYVCFLLQKHNNKHYLLKGGTIQNVGNLTPEYFYNNIVQYAETVKVFLEPYNNYLKEISLFVKAFGGEGRVHGCIIDIDFLNHIYVNPLTREIKVYYATSMVDKYVYNNLLSLLKHKNNSLYSKFKKYIGQKAIINKESSDVLHSLIESQKYTFVDNTEMYKISNLLVNLQYLTNKNIVRIWNETIIPNKAYESGRLIVSGLINKEERLKFNLESKKVEKGKIKRNLAIKPKVDKPILSNEEKQKISFTKYTTKVNPLIKGKIRVLEYIHSRVDAKYICIYCKFTWSERPDKFKDRHNYKCPKCRY